MLGTILLVILVVLLIGGMLPLGPVVAPGARYPGYGYGWPAGGGIGLVLLILLILVLLGHL